MRQIKCILHHKNHESIGYCILVVCITVINTFGQSDTKADEKSIAHLKKFRFEYVTGLMQKRPALIQRYYSENIRLMPEFQKTIIGKNNVQVYFKAFLERFDVYELSREEKEIDLGVFRMKLRSNITDRDYEVTGKYLDIWEKSADGEQVLIIAAWNYNHPLEIEDQFRFAGIPQVDIALQAHLPINNNISFELAGLNRLMEGAVSEHDTKIWSQFYADDGMFLYSRNRIFEGKEGLNKFLDAHAKGLPVFEKLDIRNDRIDDLGSYVIEYASHIANWRNGEHSGVSTGKDLRIWRRERDCSLKIFRHIGMYD